MSTYTKEFTKERLIEKLQHRISVASGFPESEKAQIDLELARIALASLEAEPVAWLLSGGGAKNHVSFDSGNAYADPLREVTPLYTDPPAPVALPSEITKLKDGRGFRYVKDGVCYSVNYANGWNQCRAAMLQSFGNSEQLNSPVIPDGWADMLQRWLVFGRGMQNAGSQLPLNLIAETEAMLAAAPQQEAKNV